MRLSGAKYKKTLGKQTVVKYVVLESLSFHWKSAEANAPVPGGSALAKGVNEKGQASDHLLGHH
jgi:hypothetical protein